MCFLLLSRVKYDELEFHVVVTLVPLKGTDTICAILFIILNNKSKAGDAAYIIYKEEGDDDAAETSFESFMGRNNEKTHMYNNQGFQAHEHEISRERKKMKTSGHPKHQHHDTH